MPWLLGSSMLYFCSSFIFIFVHTTLELNLLRESVPCSLVHCFVTQNGVCRLCPLFDFFFFFLMVIRLSFRWFTHLNNIILVCSNGDEYHSSLINILFSHFIFCSWWDGNLSQESQYKIGNLLNFSHSLC